ncbi:MAG: ribosome-associated translation inhibitor RaiA [Ignavibacteria bacterium]|nr:ribosome-associated translation inhibitor RaiA [Ignavibacteria bacterium]
MSFIFTSRHFKAHDSLKQLAEEETKKFAKIYNGIIKTEVILSFDKPENSIKYAEVIVHAKNNHTFTAKESSDDFTKSILSAIEKVEIQVRKYKDKLISHNSEHSIKNMDSEL